MAASESTHVETTIPGDVELLLKQYPELRMNRESHKVCCCLTGHEMPARKDVILSFVQGKKFLRAQQEREYDYDAHKPHLVPSDKKGHKNKLFCMLTFRHVTRNPVDVERHVTGKRYRRALERWKKCQETGETFRPRGKKRIREDSTSDDIDQPRKSKFWQLDSESDEDQLEDDMSDLYPEGDFLIDGEESEEDAENDADGKGKDGNQEEADDSDFDFDAMDVPASSGDSEQKSGKGKVRGN
ncbi:surfeit locus protein 2-like isoform X2 [Pomacea canaliculata]|uniref:surfeit locus protein 2-like isoform X2 n=1 Tax=Pomacea canaliculata TaxID=400727 RepID=UPI000D73169D|nr:surfeit locus protein 2-like isoform X2 [Pomacea canaliculata]